jgi:hypothetical protein
VENRFVCFVLVASVCAALLLWAAPPAVAQQADQDRAARITQAEAAPTPRAADGPPDLTGYWAKPRNELPIVRSEDGKTLIAVDRDAPELDARAQPRFKARAAARASKSPYKPQFQAKQRQLMYTASRIDPAIHCYPPGVPRLGPPTEILQTPTTFYFMYAAEGGEDPTHTYRIIPIGGKHDPDRDPRPDGDSIASWDRDTLVVDVTNIDPETWLTGDGDFHDENLHVVERFTRKGNTLAYDVTIEDPTLFTGPWKPLASEVSGNVAGRPGSTTRLLTEGAHAIPDYPCVERDREHKVNNDRF